MYMVNHLALQESERAWHTEAITNDLDNMASWAEALEAWESETLVKSTSDCAFRDVFDAGSLIDSWHEFRSLACATYDFLEEEADACEGVNTRT